MKQRKRRPRKGEIRIVERIVSDTVTVLKRFKGSQVIVQLEGLPPMTRHHVDGQIILYQQVIMVPVLNENGEQVENEKTGQPKLEPVLNRWVKNIGVA